MAAGTPAYYKLIYRTLYGLGTLFSLTTVSLLVWTAFCIATSQEPLAAIRFLPPMPTIFVFIFLILLMVLAVASWQVGATCQQLYEKEKNGQRG